MNPERWKRVEALLDRALDLGADERAAFLDEACADDRELRREVEELLAADARGSEFLPTTNQAGSPLTTRSAPPGLGSDESERIGGYRILQKLGEGGMGVVYEAEQEKPVRRRVALKVIKAGMDSKQVIARFESERQALALMNHTNVAKVFDVGATEQQRPYFAMELVKGVPITEHCDRQRLDTHKRLDLFMHVCDGVQHAHQKGIIHRDIKPSNILVQTEGDQRVPKIIDFGVAKATAQPLTERTMFTELGQMIGTPEYMSPEQAEMTGEDIDTRTDVYSLGVLLYELLVGALPFDSKDLRKAGFDEIRRQIREEEPSKPSTRIATLGDASTETAQRRRTDVQALRRQLSGDLDWIVMRALEKDRTRRYGSPAELTADIRRHLDHKPVEAGPPSTVYRIQKFVRRHTGGVAVAGTAVVVLLGFAVTMAVQARRIGAERDRANREAAAKGQVSEFLEGLFDVSDPDSARGSSITARELLAAGAHKIDTIAVDQPVVAADLMNVMGKVHRKLGLYPQAEPLLWKALETRRKLLGEDHPDTLVSRSLLAVLYDDQGRYDEAEPLFRQTLEARRSVLGDDHARTLESQNSLAILYARQGRFDEAEPLFRQTLETRDRVLGPDHPDTLMSRNNLAGIYWSQGRHDEAEPLYRRTVEVLEHVLGADHPTTLLSQNNLADLYTAQGRHDEAEALFDQTLRARRRVLGDEHRDTLRTQNSLALLYENQNRYEEAESLYRRTLEAQKRVIGADHPDTLISQTNLANLYLHAGRLDEAARFYHQTLEVQRRVLGDHHPNTALSLYNLACFEAVRSDRARAIDWLRQAVDAGYAKGDGMARDPDLEPLHGDAFDALVRRARDNAAAQRAE